MTSSGSLLLLINFLIFRSTLVLGRRLALLLRPHSHLGCCSHILQLQIAFLAFGAVDSAAALIHFGQAGSQHDFVDVLVPKQEAVSVDLRNPAAVLVGLQEIILVVTLSSCWSVLVFGRSTPSRRR